MKSCLISVLGVGWGNRLAFTLAEVLITLGIIGVVAAVTLPSLVANYQKQVLATQLKKEVSFIQNAFRKIIADEEVSDFASSSFVIPTVLQGDSGLENSYRIDFEKFASYFNLQKAGAETLFQKFVPENVQGYILNNGSCIASYYDPSIRGTLESGDMIIIDVNCDQKPNSIGLDRFVFTTYINIPDKFISLADYGLMEDSMVQSIKQMCVKEPEGLDSQSKIVMSVYCGYLMVYNGYEFK